MTARNGRSVGLGMGVVALEPTVPRAGIFHRQRAAPRFNVRGLPPVIGSRHDGGIDDCGTCTGSRDMKITVRPLTQERWPDLEVVFEARGCSIARGCWCMFYRRSGRQDPPEGLGRSEANKNALKALAGADPPAGLIGYRGKVPVGWVTLGPREDYRKLQRSPVARPVDDQPVWSVVCFVVPAPYRHQGVATALLDGAIAYARKRGVTLLEAYPVDKAERSRDDWLWHGAKSMYDRAGFVEVARRRPQRPVVRLTLA
jgi:GNAT superfamily N-acetyltransferase